MISRTLARKTKKGRPSFLELDQVGEQRRICYEISDECPLCTESATRPVRKINCRPRYDVHSVTRWSNLDTNLPRSVSDSLRQGGLTYNKHRSFCSSDSIPGEPSSKNRIVFFLSASSDSERTVLGALLG